MQFLAEDVAAAHEPTSDELKSWFEKNSAKFALPPRQGSSAGPPSCSIRTTCPPCTNNGVKPSYRRNRLIVECGVPLAYSTTHDIYRGF